MTMTDIAHETENLRRSVEFRAVEESDGWTLEGYAAVFGEWTEITDRMGTFQERIVPGAFKRTLDHQKPLIQFDHGQHPLIGSMPLGRISSIREDDKGLFVRARLSDNWMVEPVRDAIRDGGIDGMSFRFSITDEEWESRDGIDFRTIKEVKLFEVGPVVWPAYPTTSVGVRARQTALALTDDEVRREVAHLLALSTDEIRNLVDESPAADDPAPEGTSSDPENPPTTGHGFRTKSQRQALAALVLGPDEKD